MRDIEASDVSLSHVEGREPPLLPVVLLPMWSPRVWDTARNVTSDRTPISCASMVLAAPSRSTLAAGSPPASEAAAAPPTA
jgi:hypothetical protein